MSDHELPKVHSLEEAEQHIRALWRQVESTQRQVQRHDEELDTGWRTPLWKRVVFWVDGWPLTQVVDAPAWRPWRRWWRS